VSYVIVDLDGTLVLDDNQPNEPLIKHLNDQVMAGDAEIIVVSARKIDRLTETRAWLQEYGVAGVEQVHLNDFEGTAFETGLPFKTYKYGLLLEEYGADEIAYAVDNDEAVRTMAAALGIRAFSPEQALAISATPPADDAPDSADTIDESTQLEENSMAREHETRALPLGDFTVTEGEDGQKTFTGYAAVFNSNSEGLPFIERIAKGAFARAIKQAEQGRRVIRFLHGHDESRMLATTASGRLQLTEDEVGLKVEARLDPADPDAAQSSASCSTKPRQWGRASASPSRRAGSSGTKTGAAR
jgi:hypothetical protein